MPSKDGRKGGGQNKTTSKAARDSSFISLSNLRQDNKLTNHVGSENKSKPSCVKMKQVYLYMIFLEKRYQRIDFRKIRVGQYFTYMDYMKSYILRTHFKMYLPPVRIELTTPGLQDQCSATELKRLPYLELYKLDRNS